MEWVKQYFRGFKPDVIDVVLLALIALAYFDLLPAEIEGELVNTWNLVLAYLAKNVLPQRINDLFKAPVVEKR